MKIALIKLLIGWLWRNHKFLLVERVVPEGHHIHKNPPGKMMPNPATSGVDE